MKFVTSILFAIFFQPTVTWELCERACNEEYQAAQESCEQFDEPGDVAESLKACVETARAARASCLDNCGR